MRQIGPYETPPLAYQIAQYFRMMFSDQPADSGPEGDAFCQAMDDLAEAIWTEMQTKKYRALCDENERLRDENERLRKEHERRDAVWDRVHWKHDDEVNALRDELETALAWHKAATSRRKEVEAASARMEATLSHIASRARQYAHDAEQAGHMEAAEGFREIAGKAEAK